MFDLLYTKQTKIARLQNILNHKILTNNLNYSNASSDDRKAWLQVQSQGSLQWF